MRTRLLALAVLLLAVACDGVKIPPCVLDGTCLPSPPTSSPTPPPSPVPTTPPVNVCASRDACDCWVGVASGWEYRPCPAPPPPSPPVPSPSATPPPPSPTPPPPTPPPSPAPCVETRTRPSLGPITPTYQGQTGPTFVSLGIFVRGGIGRKDTWYERYKQEHETRVCETPDEKIIDGRRMGNWTAPEGKPFPGANVRPHDSGVSRDYIVTNAAARRCVDRDLNKVDCQTGRIEVPAGLWSSEGDVCPVALPEVVTTTCPPTPGPSPSPSTPPSPPSGAPPLNPETQNYPRPEFGTCPPWFANARSRIKVGVLGRRPCQDGPNCERITWSATEMSVRPYCEHSCYDPAGNHSPSNCRNECELWQIGGGGCQLPKTGVPESPPIIWIAHPDWGNRWEYCDQTSAPEGSPGCVSGTDCRFSHLCHDKAMNRQGITKAMVCMPGVRPPATSNDPVPAGCSTNQVQH